MNSDRYHDYWLRCSLDFNHVRLKSLDLEGIVMAYTPARSVSSWTISGFLIWFDNYYLLFIISDCVSYMIRAGNFWINRSGLRISHSKVFSSELGTLEWWISGLILDPLFFLISRINNACSSLVINLQIN